MPTYNVPLTGVANITVTVTTEETDPDKIAALAVEQTDPSVCRGCGWSAPAIGPCGAFMAWAAHWHPFQDVTNRRRVGRSSQIRSSEKELHTS